MAYEDLKSFRQDVMAIGARAQRLGFCMAAVIVDGVTDPADVVSEMYVITRVHGQGVQQLNTEVADLADHVSECAKLDRLIHSVPHTNDKGGE